MSAHLSIQEQSFLISRKLEQGLPPRQLTQVFAHLAECAACQEALNRLRNRVMQLNDTIEWTPTHLEFEQLAGYVANNLDEVEREIADNHLAACEFCAQEVQELNLLQRDLSVTWAAPHPQPKSAWRARARQTWSASSFQRIWAPALALSALVLLTVVGVWWQRRAVETSVAQQPIPAPSQASEATSSNNVRPVPSTAEAAESLLALTDNGQAISLSKDGNLTTALALPPAYREILATTLSQQRLVLPPALKLLAQPSRTLKGPEPGSPSFSVLAPIGVVLRSDRPLFRWRSVAGAASYTVAVFDEDFNAIQNSGSLTQMQWRAAQPLPRGRILLWQVTANVGDKQITAPAAPAPEARFQILAAKPAAELQRAQREFPNSHLLLGTLYAQAGLTEEAAREFQALQAENPQSTVIKKLLQQLR
jgi:hypothetical protein